MQAKRWGGLKPSTLNGLRKNAARVPSKPNSAVPETRLALKPGTRLVREWNGRAHTVEVLDQGFLWNGEAYPSLSAVARAITGARWSGPRFFGLKGGGLA